MKINIITLFGIVLCFNFGNPIDSQSKTINANINKILEEKSISSIENSFYFGFIPNKGQYDKSVSYYSKIKNTNTYFTLKNIVIFPDKKISQKSLKQVSLKLNWKNINPKVTINSTEATEGVCNYYIGNNSDKWQTNVPVYKNLVYKNLYKGIDLSYSIEDGLLRGDYIVTAGNDPQKIKFSYNGARHIRLLRNGDLEIKAYKTKLIQKKPVSYQIINGAKKIITSRYLVSSSGDIGFALGNYDRSHELIIDPTLVYASYFGGSLLDYFQSFKMDGTGNLYISGHTLSADIPLKNSQRLSDSTTLDIFMSKFDKSGNQIYASYFGGKMNDKLNCMALDSIGQVYLGGTTQSTDFPILNNKYGIVNNGFVQPGGFLMKLDVNGKMLSSTVFSNDTITDISGDINDICLDGNGNIYVFGLMSGYTYGSQRPLYPLKEIGDKSSTSVWTDFCKFSPDMSVNYFCRVYSIDIVLHPYFHSVDSDGNIYLATERYNYDPPFPMVNSYQSTFGGGNSDAFLVKLNPDASQIIYSTFLGGRGDELNLGSGMSFFVDKPGNFYVAGKITPPFFHSKFFSQNNIKNNPSNNDSVWCSVVKFNPAGSLIYSIGIDDSANDKFSGWGSWNPSIISDGVQNVYCVFAGPNLPLVNPIQSDNSLYLVKLNNIYDRVIFGTYLGKNLVPASVAGSKESYALSVSSNGRYIGIGGYDLDNSGNQPVSDNALMKTPITYHNLWFAILEDTCSAIVTNTNDDGPGSLRAAIQCANNQGNVNVTFDLNPSDPNYSNGVYTIKIISPLPEISSNGIWIDGSSQLKKANSNPDGPAIQIVPDNSFTGNNAILVTGSNCTVMDVAVNGFVKSDTATAIIIRGANAQNNTITLCNIGVTPDGKKSYGNTYGINLGGGAKNNTVRICNIGGNSKTGIVIFSSDSNQIQSCYIGCNQGADDTIPNYNGIQILGSRYNMIGGHNERNYISGNTEYGIYIGISSSYNYVYGNFIGLNYRGDSVLRNLTGVCIDNCTENHIGGNDPNYRNIISGNKDNNVLIMGSTAEYNVIEGNYIGTDKSGSKGIEINFDYFSVIGITIKDGWFNVIGGNNSSSANVISGNYNGIKLINSFNDTIQGNIIGLDFTGLSKIGNEVDGIDIVNSGKNLIGDSTAGGRNIISANANYGIAIRGENGTGENKIIGNYIGTYLVTSQEAGNGVCGIFIKNSPGNIIGGNNQNSMNVISGNRRAGLLGAGIWITGPESDSNIVTGNFIGLNGVGTLAIPNSNGIVIALGASNNVIGRENQGERNVISGNDLYGLYINGESLNNNTPLPQNNNILGNYIGTDLNGKALIPNGTGIGLYYCRYNKIGSSNKPSNLIEGNSKSGVKILASNTI